MGGIANFIGKTVGSLFGGVSKAFGGGGDAPTIQMPAAPTPQVAAAAPQVAAATANTPESTPTEQTSATDTSRRRRGKAALTIPTSGSGTGGTGLNI